MVKDNKIMSAVSQIIVRAEKRTEEHESIDTFVDSIGIIAQLSNKNSQILYGRRGTGKTHVLQVLGLKLMEQKTATVVYIDARTLGSTSQFSDPSIPIRHRCLALFRDILEPIHQELQRHIVNFPPEKSGDALKALHDLSIVIFDPVRKYREDTLTTTFATSSGKSTTVSAKTDFTQSAGFGLESTKENKNNQEIKQSFTVEIEDKVFFPDLYETLNNTLKLAETQLYVLIDEWSSLPLDIQPYLAQFLRRGLIPAKNSVLKIASLEHRSQFSKYEADTIVGLELSADISQTLDLDDYYVYDRNPEWVSETYADIIFRHISIGLPHNYLNDQYGITNGKTLIAKLFTEQKTFYELARASEGVVRDLIWIFHVAFFDARKRERDSIDLQAITQAARQHYEQDKLHNLTESMRQVLEQIVSEVIGQKKTRAFLVRRDLEKHSMLQKLFDTRVLHRIQRGYADKDNPGVRYNIYALDYGTYIDFTGTVREPDLFISDEQINKRPVQLIIPFSNQEQEEFIVPFNDKRRIRRVIVTEQILEGTAK